METLIGLHDIWSIYRNSWLISNPGEILCMRGKSLLLLLTSPPIILSYRHSHRPRTFNARYLSQQKQRAD